MVKSIKYIFTRVLIGVGIAIILMSLKGGLIGNVYAEQSSVSLSYESIAPSLDYSLGSPWTGWGKGTLTFTVGFYDYALDTGRNLTNVPTAIFVTKSNGVDINCSFSGVTAPQDLEYIDGHGWLPGYMTSTYSATCPLDLGSGVSVSSIHVRSYGAAINSHIRLTGTATFTQDNISTSIDNTTNAVNGATNAIDETNSILEDSNVSSDTNTSLESMLQAKDSNTPVADLLLLPLTLFNAYLTGFNGSCASFNLGTLFNHEISLPCINIGGLLGAELWSIIDVIFCLFMILNIAQLFIYMFESITSFEDPYRDVYVPKHTYQPKHGGDN